MKSNHRILLSFQILAVLVLARPASADEAPDLDLRAWIQPVPKSALFSDPDYYIWCGSMVRDNRGECHLFYSRWRRHLGFDAWVSHSEIAHAISDNPLGPYRHKDVALPARGKEFWDGLCTHDPTAMRFGSKYYLYYMGNTADHYMGDAPEMAVMKTQRWVHRNNQRIGVAVADSPDGPWQRMDKPLVVPTPGFFDALCCTDPTVTARPGGGYVMVYKAVGDKGKLPFGGPVVLIAATSDSPTGPFTKHPEPAFFKEGTAFAAEDPFIWNADNRCWAIIKDQGGFYTDKGGKGKSLVLFQSADGLHWNLAKHPFITTPEVTWEGGRHETLAQLERPQIWLEKGQPAILFCAADNSEKRARSFNIQIPLKQPAANSELIRLSQDDPATRKNILERMAHYKVPGMSIAVIQDNHVLFARSYGVVEPGGAAVTEETRFQAASISKAVAALGVLRLVQEGKLTLDDDLNRFLVSWKIKDNAFTAKKAVTLRDVLSHTAGFNVHGFAGYAAGDSMPSLLQVLDGKAPANSAAIAVVAPPGTRFSYSGGGITVMQQAVIDVTHEPFAKTMQQKVLGPLGMKNSTYEQPLPRDWQAMAAVAHRGGKPIPGKWHTYPELAAAGLWTTPSDLAHYVIALQHAGRGDPGALLPPDLARQMLTKQHGSWGLGVQVDGAGPTLRFSHGGHNEGFLSQMIGYVQSGQGVVVMINNDTDKAGALIQEMVRDARVEFGWPE